MKWQIKEPSELYPFLVAAAPESSGNTVRSWIRSGRISINGILAKSGHDLIKPGDQLQLNSRTPRLESGVKLLHEDRYLVAIYKPHGLLSVETDFQKETSAHTVLMDHYQNRNVFVVHRIDQETSGVMIFAREEKAYDKIKKLFEEHQIDREYWAIVKGAPKVAKGTWNSYLREDSNFRVHSFINPQANTSQAITHYEVAAQEKEYTLLKLRLETGRKHQIRVHCATAGFPILGDKRYGSGENPLRRMALHAGRLSFIHPITQQKINLVSPLPPVFLKLIPGAQPYGRIIEEPNGDGQMDDE